MTLKFLSKKRKRAATGLSIHPSLLSPISKKKYQAKLRKLKFMRNAKDKLAALTASHEVLKRKHAILERKLFESQESLADSIKSTDVADDDESALSFSVGSSDPHDEDFDPLDDCDANLCSFRLRQLMERASLSKTTFNMLTGHTEEEFENLARDMHNFIAGTTLTGEKIARGSHQDVSWTVRPREQLFVTLVWLRWSFTYAFLSFFVSLPARYVQKIIKRCTAALARASGRRDRPTRSSR
jgi:hypothetical protein